jgi:hypothetical protein
MNLAEKADALWRKLVFFVGDVHRLHHFPWVSWTAHQHGVDYDEILEGLGKIQYGDIGLHRDWGYLSNIAIPGFLKHGWIHVQDGLECPRIVEAISEGVISRNAVYPMFSDYTVIVRPLGVTEEERKGACKKAKQVIGSGYDVYFQFDIEEQLKYYQGRDSEGAVADLQQAEAHLRRYNPAFSCTELCSYAWWHKREQLRLYRKIRRGGSNIIADDFLNNGWEIVWLSKSVTADIARQYGLPEEGLEMIADYRRKNP